MNESVPASMDLVDAAVATVAAGGRATIHWNGIEVALISMEDLRYLQDVEQEEDELLAELALESIAEQRALGEPGIALDDLRAKHGL